MRYVANSATIIRTMAPKRSDQAARLKNTHHRTIASAAEESPKQRKEQGVGHDNRDDKPEQPLQDHDDHAGPEPERAGIG